MFEVHKNLFIGDENDIRNFEAFGDWEDYYILFAAKDPWHRNMVGYTGRGCPKDDLNYLYIRKDNCMALNMVDADNPMFFSKEMIDKGLDFMQEGWVRGAKVLVVCNKGQSRSPSIAMLFMSARLKVLFDTFEESLLAFTHLYSYELTGFNARETLYCPANGILGHIMENWREYCK